MQSARPKEQAAPLRNDGIVIKKYPNRRLYDTHTSSYVTLDDLCTLVKQGMEFVVVDAKTNEDLTRQILTQIIFEQESKGYNMLPVSFLRSVIGFYDNAKMQPIVPHYLDMAMNNFSANQDKVRQFMDHASGGNVSPFGQFGEIGKQHMAMFSQAMQMFNPLGFFGDRIPEKKKKAAGEK